MDLGPESVGREASLHKLFIVVIHSVHLLHFPEEAELHNFQRRRKGWGGGGDRRNKIGCSQYQL